MICRPSLESRLRPGLQWKGTARIAEGCFAFSTAAEVEIYLKSQITLDVAESID